MVVAAAVAARPRSLISPNGDQALAQVLSDLYVVTIPWIGGTEPTVTVGNPENATFPVRKLTDIGGQFPSWSADGQNVHWSIGNAHVVYDLERGEGVRRLGASRQSRARDGAARLAVIQRLLAADAGRPPTTAIPADERRILITAQRDIPSGNAVLRGARVITMKGNEVIENADIVVVNNRIRAVGRARQRHSADGRARRSTSPARRSCPGFVDTHAHLRLSQRRPPRAGVELRRRISPTA